MTSSMGTKELNGCWALAIHGGAGVIARKSLTTHQETAYRAALHQTVELSEGILREGGSALDAVEAAVRRMEDDPLFNAGRGAVFTSEGRNELDAAIMDGQTLAAGAVGGVTRTRNPISLARAVMEHSEHVMLIGTGADSFARLRHLEQAEPAYFFSERRWQSMKKFLDDKGWPLPIRPVRGKPDQDTELVHDEGKWGTVGAVALDQHGHLAAATSTGGLTGKCFGRVGDSPIIGAGCYATDATCAVSCTGDGEYFIRLAVAHRIAARMEFQRDSLQDAVDAVIQNDLMELGGRGGVIAVAPDGQIAWSFNTEGMYRARVSSTTPLVVGLYGDDTKGT